VASIACECGNGISLHHGPSENILYLISDRAMYELSDTLAEIVRATTSSDVDSRVRSVYDLLSSYATPAIRQTAKCPICGRLLVLDQSGAVMAVYRPDAGATLGPGYSVDPSNGSV
jgi:hypothetical protein